MTALLQKGAADTRELLRHMRRRWYVWAALVAIWTLAYTRLFVDPTPRAPLLFNVTPSLPYRVALLLPRPVLLKRGDHIVYAFDGSAQAPYPGLRRQPFFKIVRGLPGDAITVADRVVHINGEPVGFAKTHTKDGWRLEPIDAVVIPPGHYYVQGTDPDSFDSRYRSSGLVRDDQILGAALPIF